MRGLDLAVRITIEKIVHGGRFLETKKLEAGYVRYDSPRRQAASSTDGQNATPTINI